MNGNDERTQHPNASISHGPTITIDIIVVKALTVKMSGGKYFTISMTSLKWHECNIWLKIDKFFFTLDVGTNFSFCQ